MRLILLCHHFGLGKKDFKDIVVRPNPLAFNYKPLSDVSSIGFTDLYFRATLYIILSGERL